MRVRLVIVGVFAAGLLGSAGLFGDDQPRGGRGRGSLPASWGRLGLSDDQKQHIYTIEADYRAKIDALNKQVADLRKKLQAERLKVLTDAQRARLKEIVASRAGEDEEKKPAAPDKK
jgi:Spy/CpxP family protein refolding chaperone